MLSRVVYRTKTLLASVKCRFFNKYGYNFTLIFFYNADSIFWLSALWYLYSVGFFATVGLYAQRMNIEATE